MQIQKEQAYSTVGGKVPDLDLTRAKKIMEINISRQLEQLKQKELQ